MESVEYERSTRSNSGRDKPLVLEERIAIFQWESSQFGAELVRTKYVPGNLFDRYIEAAMRKALTSNLEDGTVFAEIPGFEGVWGNGATEEDALIDLRAALPDWVLLKIETSDRDLPTISNIDLNDI